MDIGPATAASFTEVVAEGRRTIGVEFPGPMGIFETRALPRGHLPWHKAVVEAMRSRMVRQKYIIGGGDSVKALNEAAKLGDKVTFMSTGGGASSGTFWKAHDTACRGTAALAGQQLKRGLSTRLAIK